MAVLGVVYGDIGTSPIYALRESFSGHSAVAVSPSNILDILSLIFWALILVVSLKYMIFILLGILGASMLYGGMMITPAISVLSAIEGLQIAAPHLEPLVVPITVIVLLMLFAFQRHGTAKVGAVFGPLTLVWFAFVLPALLLNYFGQGALLLSDPSGNVDPFFHLAHRRRADDRTDCQVLDR